MFRYERRHIPQILMKITRLCVRKSWQVYFMGTHCTPEKEKINESSLSELVISTCDKHHKVVLLMLKILQLNWIFTVISPTSRK